jgi:hypothetical protein
VNVPLEDVDFAERVFAADDFLAAAVLRAPVLARGLGILVTSAFVVDAINATALHRSGTCAADERNAIYVGVHSQRPRPSESPLHPTGVPYGRSTVRKGDHFDERQFSRSASTAGGLSRSDSAARASVTHSHGTARDQTLGDGQRG